MGGGDNAAAADMGALADEVVAWMMPGFDPEVVAPPPGRAAAVTPTVVGTIIPPPPPTVA